MRRSSLVVSFCSACMACVLFSPVTEGVSTTQVSAYQARAVLRARARMSARSSARNARRTSSKSNARYVPPVRTSSQSSSAQNTEDASVAAKMEDVFALVNAERKKKGLPAYKRNLKLDAAARAPAKDMVRRNFFDHISPEGTTPKNRIEKEGYMGISIRTCNCSSLRYTVGENIAKGQKTAAQVMEDWMNSPTHRDAILSPTFAEIGIGISGDVWVQTFGAIITTPAK